MEEQNYNSFENKTDGQKEIETEEIKSFGSFLKLCWSTKTARRSIILGVIVLFIGGFLAIKPSIDGEYHHGFEGFALIVVSMITIAISSVVVIIGTWWGIRKKAGITSLNSLFIIITVIGFYFGPLVVIDSLFGHGGDFYVFVISFAGTILLCSILNIIIMYLIVRKKVNQKIFNR